ncbi:hypothetical protein D052_3224 [Vibrio parahaemolyticus 10290]|nr:hypothetical protein D052_3224 [Vibrio parahaemolyticus 10290]
MVMSSKQQHSQTPTKTASALKQVGINCAFKVVLQSVT